MNNVIIIDVMLMNNDGSKNILICFNNRIRNLIDRNNSDVVDQSLNEDTRLHDRVLMKGTITARTGFCNDPIFRMLISKILSEKTNNFFFPYKIISVT